MDTRWSVRGTARTPGLIPAFTGPALLPSHCGKIQPVIAHWPRAVHTAHRCRRRRFAVIQQSHEPNAGTDSDVRWRNTPREGQQQSGWQATDPPSRRRAGKDAGTQTPAWEAERQPPRRQGQSRKRTRPASKLDDFDYIDDDDEDFEDPSLQWYRQRPQDLGGVFGWLKRFYNALFWYGAALDDDAAPPAMNFKDLMEQYEFTERRLRARGPTARGPEEDRDFKRGPPPGMPPGKGEDWVYRWRPGRDSGRTDGDDGDRRREAGREGEARSRSSRDRQSTRRPRDAPPAPVRQDPPRAMAEGLRAKARALAAREAQLVADGKALEDKLKVLDVTLELWVRRSRAMRSTSEGVGGDPELDDRLQQAKRRIFDLKEEAKALDNAKHEVQHRLDNCRGMLRRVTQELENVAVGGRGPRDLEVDGYMDDVPQDELAEDSLPADVAEDASETEASVKEAAVETAEVEVVVVGEKTDKSVA